jgi:alpha-glucoside transport system substrate-binding protein
MLALAAAVVGPVSISRAQDDIECFDSNGSSVSVISVWAGEEEETFKQVLSPVLEACDLTLNHEGTRDLPTVLSTRVDGGEPPDIASMPNVGALQQYADQLVPLADVNVNADNYNQSWQDLGSVDGTWYGLPIKTDIKSLVWYSPLSFELEGYEVPTTWEDFTALLDTMAGTDTPPLAMGFESGGATGWTGTDFVQDILLRTQSAEYVRGLDTGDTSWTDQGVVDAWTMYVDWVNKYAAGGSEGTLTTSFNDAILQPFQDPSEAWMVKQSGFAGTATIQPAFPDFQYGEDFAFFVLPGIGGDPAPMQVGADFIAVFNNTPAVQAIMAYLTSAPGATAWAASGFDLTPNSAVDISAYENPISADKAQALLDAPEVVFDVGDLLPGGAGQAEFDAITAAVGGADVAEQLATIQQAFDEASGG